MTDVPSILEQAHPWKAGVFNFGKAKREDTSYFNCCIIERGGRLWLITRRAVWEPDLIFGKNSLMAFRLSDKLVPEFGMKLNIDGQPMDHFEDPRAFYHNNNLWVSAVTFIVYGTPKNRRWSGAHQIIASVSDDWRSIKRYDPIYGQNGRDMFSNTGTGHEKNWLWFSHDERPHLVYSAKPHHIVRFSDEFKHEETYLTNPEITWDFGEIRGGTTPVRIGDYYWTFFHSSVPWLNKKRQYHMGAYAFEAEPPFKMVRITPYPLLTGSQHDRWYPGKPLVVFPCGALFRDSTWLIVGGLNDLDSFYVEIPHHDLLTRTVPVKSTEPLTKDQSLVTDAA